MSPSAIIYAFRRTLRGAAAYRPCCRAFDGFPRSHFLGGIGRFAGPDLRATNMVCYNI